MVAIKLIIVLSLACLSAAAVSPIDPGKRNTIFADERFEGEVFENVDAFDNIELTPKSVGVSPYRLPTTTAPIKYDVTWVINFETTRTYSGTVVITLAARQENVTEIVIHSDHTDNTNVVLRQGAIIVPTTARSLKDYQFFIVTLNEGVLDYNETTPVNYTLSIDFAATFRTDMYGIYESWFKNTPQEDVQWMATTQFQATAARYAFPCYDEPSFKAVFSVKIRRPSNYGTWFCTRLVSDLETSLNETEATYAETPIMSTYLLALIVADYRAIDNNNTKLHEVIAREGALIEGQGDYALAAGQALLDKMSEITDYDFYSQHPNLKMTQAAIPDFGAGAMENWGLLTYREAYLLSDPKRTSSHFKQIIAYILSHEITHMWYGNLVTNDWWDVLWLNEGFARYYQYFLTNEVEAMGFDIRFVPEQVHTSLLSDSSNNPHPLTNPGVGSPASVSAMFSTITYNKGAAIIRMTEHLLGKNVHDQGLRQYLKDNAFKTTKPIDLFNALRDAGVQNGAFNNYGPSFDFVAYYKSWTEQPGHPILNVQINHRTGLMTIQQRRFNINSGYSLQNTLYDIPITFTTNFNPDFENTKPTHIIKDSVTVIDRGVYGDHWTLFNIKQTGFYRVNYDDYTWNLIALALRGDDRLRIHELNKAQIVNDVFSFARAGIMDYHRALHILSFLSEETDYAPWAAAITGFNWVRNRLVGNKLASNLDDIIRTWADKAIKSLTYEPTDDNEEFMRRYFRFQLAPFMCNVGSQECKDKAKTLFEKLKATPTVEVDRDSRNWVYCNGLRQGTEGDFTFMWNRFLAENLYTEKIVLLQTLGCTPHENSLNILLSQILRRVDPVVRAQDYNTAINAAVSGNEGNTQIVLKYFKNPENLQALSVAYNNDLRTPLSYISARLRTPEEVTDFQNWVKTAGVQHADDISKGAEDTLKSFDIGSSIANDLDNFLTGDDPISTTTALPTTTPSATTVTAPPLVEPTTPALPEPDSAVTSVVSIFLLALAGLAHLIL